MYEAKSVNTITFKLFCTKIKCKCKSKSIAKSNITIAEGRASLRSIDNVHKDKLTHKQLSTFINGREMDV